MIVAATADNPSHPNTPDTWCGYRNDPEKYKHTNGLLQAIVDLVSPIFEDLSKEELLSKCLHGQKQNGNKCLNNLIWQRCSKEIYVDRITVEEAVYSAVSYFNGGSILILKTLEKLGVKAGYHTETRTSWWRVALFRPTQKCEWASSGPLYETVIYFIF